MTAIGLFLLPVGLVKLTGLYLGQQGPSAAQAAEADPSAPAANAAPTKAPTWTTRQVEAGKYIASLRGKSCGPTPFLYEARDPQSTAVTVSSDPVPIGTPTTDVSKYTVQAILSSSMGTTALINGKPYRVGDTIRESSWVIQTIAADTRSVTLRDSVQGRLETIHVEIPSISKQ
jgi:hypothetical protein